MTKLTSQFCAEYAEKVKNLPDIWELRTEVVHLKQENARLVKKIADMKSEHGESGFRHSHIEIDIAKRLAILPSRMARNLMILISNEMSIFLGLATLQTISVTAWR